MYSQNLRLCVWSHTPPSILIPVNWIRGVYIDLITFTIQSVTLGWNTTNLK